MQSCKTPLTSVLCGDKFHHLAHQIPVYYGGKEVRWARMPVSLLALSLEEGY